MTKQTETAKTATKRAPYEAPRLTMVELKPEEALLSCGKFVALPICEFMEAGS